ncbi:hypothetical protein [Thermicanus aegyptius]|uniref:hypothetical protein n=1 Tax=Thermicanus aegyptius TaxID=94009 RepID=UPI0004197A1E|nr:hypothetical protein [Thermicanus aegyptius]
MKKTLAIALIVVGLLGIGTVAFAQGNNPTAPWNLNFDQMLPFMKQMHPNWSTDQLNEMYNDCHGPNGFMQKGSVNFGNSGNGGSL